MMTAPAYRRYQAFLAKDRPDPHPELMTMDNSAQPAALVPTCKLVSKEAPEGRSVMNKQVIVNKEDTMVGAQQLLMRWHHRLGHASFRKLQAMAARGELPSKMKDCAILLCSACTYGKQTKQPWQGKPTTNRQRTMVAKGPREIVSADVLDSSVPGFVGQMRGNLTVQRYTGACVFVDQFSGLSYTHLLVNKTAANLAAAKDAFLLYCRKYGVAVKHFHANNSIFESKEFRKSVESTGQTISYCGVNAHHQNGVAKKQIQDLQDQARTILIHAQRQWPEAVNVHLWPYAIRKAEQAHCISPKLQRGEDGKHRSPIKLFAGVNVRPTLTDKHPFGCPVYVLSDKGQQYAKSIPKWTERSRVGVYLGHLPQHARSVGLVLNLATGHMSPQFHCVYDDQFLTVWAGVGKIKSKWQSLARLATKHTKIPDIDSKQTVLAGKGQQTSTQEAHKRPD